MEKYILIVGRSEDEDSFAKLIQKSLPIGFEIEAIYSLNEYYEADNKDRFIAFVVCEDEEIFKAHVEQILNKTRLKGYGSSAFPNIDEALLYAENEYGFSGDEEEREKRLSELHERFPLFSAEEWEQIHIFDSLYHTGKVRPIRGRYMDEPVIILAHITSGVDEIRITPMMILINDGIHEEIEVPFE